MERLQIKNVGPIKNVLLELKKVNVFIGKNSMGGIQTLLPLYLTLEYLNSIDKEFVAEFFNENKNSIFKENNIMANKKSYILEEPELNLFPKEQFEVVKFMIQNSHSVVFVTHSPYVLYCLNILLYAYEVGNISQKSKEEVDKIISEEYWINPKEFGAFYFDDGGAESFFNGKLIDDNLIDDVSNEFEEIFEELREIKRSIKSGV